MMVMMVMMVMMAMMVMMVIMAMMAKMAKMAKMAMMAIMVRMKTSSLVDIGNHPPLGPGPPTPRVAVTPEWPSLITLVDT